MQIQVAEILALPACLNLFLRCVTIHLIWSGFQTSAVSTDEIMMNDEAHGGNLGAAVPEANGKGPAVRSCVDGPKRMRDEFVSRSLEFHGELYSDRQTAHGLRG